MLTLNVNGERREVEVPAEMPLLWVLRDVLGLTGTKFGCGIAQCGACTVHLDGKPVRSCLLPVSAIGTPQSRPSRPSATRPTVRGCRRPGWIWKSSSAAIVSRARSCRRPRCSIPSHIRMMPTSMPPWPATSAGAAPTSAFDRPFLRLPSQ